MDFEEITKIVLGELDSTDQYSDCDSEMSVISDSSTDSTNIDVLMRIVPFFLVNDERKHISRFLEEVVPSYTDQEFSKQFRINRTLYKRLVDMFSKSFDYLKLESRKRYSAELHIALFLWFAGHETCIYRDIADKFNLALGTVCVVLDRVIRFISNLCDSVVRWPTDEEKLQTSSYMRLKTGMKGVIGVIGSTRIRIDNPKPGKDKRNVTSLCLQAICNEKGTFLDIFVGGPGSAHYNRIFEHSELLPQLPNLCGNGFLLGEYAYPCSQHLVTPYRYNGRFSSRQTFFNRKLNSGRIVIDQSFCLLKQRFPQLNYCRLRGIVKLCQFIRACVVLHNLCNDDELLCKRNESMKRNDHSIIADDQKRGLKLRHKLSEEVLSYFNRV